MTSPEDLVRVADASLFIFVGSIARTSASTLPALSVDDATAVVSVQDVIKSPAGLRGFAGREVTVQLQRPLKPGDYVFFAEPIAVGGGIAVKELAHLDATEREKATTAVERAYAELIASRAKAAFLIALGTIGPVRRLVPPEESYHKVPWGSAPLEIERALKGKPKPRNVILVGPVHASMRFKRAPALRAGLRAIFFLQRPPRDAIDAMPEDEHQSAAFIAETWDIQPPERIDTILRIIGGAEQE